MTTAPELTTRQIKELLRRGRFSSVGSYPLFFITSDCAALSFAAVREEWHNVCAAVRSSSGDGWQVVACAVNWEDPALFCDHTSERIESAYAEDEANAGKLTTDDLATLTAALALRLADPADEGGPQVEMCSVGYVDLWRDGDVIADGNTLAKIDTDGMGF